MRAVSFRRFLKFVLPLNFFIILMNLAKNSNELITSDVAITSVPYNLSTHKFFKSLLQCKLIFD